MNALAATEYYASNQVVRYDPQAAQQARDVAAQQQRQLRVVASVSTLSEQTLEGELLNKREQRNEEKSGGFANEEYLARHQNEYARAARGHMNQSQQAIDAYQSTALLTHPADVDRVGMLDIYV